MMAANVPIRKIAQDLCSDIDDTNYSKEMIFFRHVVNGYHDLLVDVIPNVQAFNIKSEVYRIGDNLAVDLPADFLYYTKIGICQEGRLINLLGYDTSICKTGLRDYCTDNNTEQVAFNNVWWGGTYYGELYAQPGGYTNNGYYDLDKHNNRIIFKDIDINADIIVEYQSMDNGAAVVPIECEIALKEYAFWRYRKGKGGNYQQERRDYIGEYKRLKRFYTTKTARELHDALLRGVYSTVKR